MKHLTAFEQRARAISEKELQEAVEQLLGLHRWLFFHDRDSRRNNAGFPDIVAIGHGRHLAIELKKIGFKPREQQRIWLDAFRSIGAEVYVWTPMQWLDGTITSTLSPKLFAAA